MDEWYQSLSECCFIETRHFIVFDNIDKVVKLLAPIRPIFTNLAKSLLRRVSVLYRGNHVFYVHPTMWYGKEQDSASSFQSWAASLLILDQKLSNCQLSLSYRWDELALFNMLPPKL